VTAVTNKLVLALTLVLLADASARADDDVTAGVPLDIRFHALPDLALRASWSESYGVEWASTFRPLPALALLSVRASLSVTPTRYIGIQLSLLDPIAPLAELTMRRDVIPINDGGFLYRTDWIHEKRLLANVVQPRLAVEVALSRLSPHLVFDVGVAIRAAAPYEIMEYGYDHLRFDYRYPWSEDATVRHALDLSASIKFVP